MVGRVDDGVWKGPSCSHIIIICSTLLTDWCGAVVGHYPHRIGPFGYLQLVPPDFMDMEHDLGPPPTTTTTG